MSEWVGHSGRTTDPIGLQQAQKRLAGVFEELAMRPVPELTNPPSNWIWETERGLDDGLLLIGYLDVPIDVGFPMQPFRREPEWLYGEGVGSSRAPMVMLEYALRALRSMRRLKQLPLGVLYYADEGLDARYSAKTIRAAAARAKEVLILRPGNIGDRVVTQRRGQRRYLFRVEGEPERPGRASRRVNPLRWTWNKLETIAQLTSQRERVSVSTMDMHTERLPMRLPHRVNSTLVITYPDAATADAVVGKIREAIGKGGPRWDLELVADRPPMLERPEGMRLYEEWKQLADKWEMPLDHESSVWPSVAGLLPPDKACLCGVGPVARDLRTPQECIQRISMVHRTLLLTEFLVGRLGR